MSARRISINEAIGMFQLSRMNPKQHVIDDIADLLIEAATLAATFDPDVILRDAVADEIKKCSSYRCTCAAASMVQAAVLAWFRETARIEGIPEEAE